MLDSKHVVIKSKFIAAGIYSKLIFRKYLIACVNWKHLTVKFKFTLTLSLEYRFRTYARRNLSHSDLNHFVTLRVESTNLPSIERNFKLSQSI